MRVDDEIKYHIGFPLIDVKEKAVQKACFWNYQKANKK